MRLKNINSENFKIVTYLALVLLFGLSFLIIYVNKNKILLGSGNNSINVLDKNANLKSLDPKVVELEKKNNPPILSNTVEYTINEFEILKNYAVKNNVIIPENIQNLAMQNKRFEAAPLLKDLMYKKYVSYKNITFVQIVYQTGVKENENDMKQKVQNSLSSIVSKVKIGQDFNKLANTLKNQYSDSVLIIDTLEEFDCKSTELNFDENVKSAALNLKKLQISEPIERSGYSYVLLYVNDENNEDFCSYDEFYSSVLSSR